MRWYHVFYKTQFPLLPFFVFVLFFTLLQHGTRLRTCVQSFPMKSQAIALQNYATSFVGHTGRSSYDITISDFSSECLFAVVDILKLYP